MNSQRWRRIPSLPLQLFIITVLPLTLLLLTIAFGSLGLHQRAMRTMVGERDERATRAASAAISEQIHYRQSAIRSVALQVANVSEPEHALADASFLLPEFEGGVALYTTSGELLAASNGIEVWQTRAIPERWPAFRATSADSNAYFLPSLIDPIRDEELMLIAAATDEFIAVGAFSPTSLVRQALADIFSSNDQAATYVVTTDGKILYQAGTPHWSDSQLNEHPGIAAALRGESGTTYLNVAGEEHVIAFSPITPVGWALVIEEPWRAVTDPLLRATEMAPLILIPVLVIALVALGFGIRQVVQPLQSLEKKATELGWGDFAAIEEPVGGINEIQRLQTELIHMARKVQLAQQSLRGYLSAVTTGQEDERRRLARDLHDDTIQSLIALNQQIQLAQMSATDDGNTDRLATMQQMAEQIVADLRRLTRDLRPIYLEDLGLIPALEMLGQDMSQSTGLPILFEKSGRERRLSSNVELALYRIAQEGLSNVVRHAAANQAKVSLQFGNGEVNLAIEDDGLGFVVPESPAEMAPAGHFGLLGVQERAETIGARLHIKSAPGCGTSLQVSLTMREYVVDQR
ncbi:MAG: histidine kinase [Candidatus Promineifilaceae bacterium]